MKIPRIMIAAPASGSGKTSVTVALLKNLANGGYNPVSVKAGPDYIDPLFHRTINGVEAYNLDTYFTDKKTTEELLAADASGHGIAVLEGVMGLYDGVGGVLETGSSYDLAACTNTPVILIVNARGAGRSLASVIAGMKAFDRENLIRGVILNRTSVKFYEIVKPVIERECSVKVLGFLSERKDAVISSRHLGLVTPDEIDGLKEITGRLAEEFSKNVDLNAVLEIAGSAPELAAFPPPAKIQAEKCVIAVSKDEAFSFFYEENIRLLQNLGARIVFFSPLHDPEVPEDADALILTGGYPEFHLNELCKNTGMAKSIRGLYENGIPVMAECGGFIYLHRTIRDIEKREYRGVGLVDAECVYTGRSVRFGYVEISETEPDFLKRGDIVKGHEFHYYESTDTGECCTATKPFNGQSHECIIKNSHSWFGFAHLYYPSNPDFAKSFVQKATEYRSGKTKRKNETMKQ